MAHEHCNTGTNLFFFKWNVRNLRPALLLVLMLSAPALVNTGHLSCQSDFLADSQTWSDFPTQNLDPNSCCQTSLNAQTSYLDWQPCIIQTALFPVLFSCRNTHLLPGFSEFSHLPTFLCSIPFFSHVLPVCQNLHLLLLHLLPNFIMLPRVCLAVVW